MLVLISDLKNYNTGFILGFNTPDTQGGRGPRIGTTVKWHTHHSTPHCRCEELILVFDVEVLQPVLLKRSCEVLGLRGYGVFAGVEILGEAIERRGLGDEVILLNRQLDVKDFSVCAQHIPGHVDLYKVDLLIHYLRETCQGKNSHKLSAVQLKCCT